MNHFEPPFFHLPMPVNENLEGPITDGTHYKILWEVWDSCNQTVSMHDSEIEAIQAAERYNTPYCGDSQAS